MLLLLPDFCRVVHSRLLDVINPAAETSRPSSSMWRRRWGLQWRVSRRLAVVVTTRASSRRRWRGGAWQETRPAALVHCRTVRNTAALVHCSTVRQCRYRRAGAPCWTPGPPGRHGVSGELQHTKHSSQSSHRWEKVRRRGDRKVEVQILSCEASVVEYQLSWSAQYS